MDLVLKNMMDLRHVLKIEGKHRVIPCLFFLFFFIFDSNIVQEINKNNKKKKVLILEYRRVSFPQKLTQKHERESCLTVQRISKDLVSIKSCNGTHCTSFSPLWISFLRNSHVASPFLYGAVKKRDGAVAVIIVEE